MQARAKREAEESELRLKRVADREALAAKRAESEVDEEVPMTAAAEQKTQSEKILDKLKWVHRRVPLY